MTVSNPSGPWWRYGHVWLLLGLLSFAIAASCGLLYAAVQINKTDTIYSDPRHPQDGSAPKAVAQPRLLPAQEARNHAATGGVGAPNLLKPASAPGSAGAAPDAPVDD